MSSQAKHQTRLIDSRKLVAFDRSLEFTHACNAMHSSRLDVGTQFQKFSIYRSSQMRGFVFCHTADKTPTVIYYSC